MLSSDPATQFWDRNVSKNSKDQYWGENFVVMGEPSSKGSKKIASERPFVKKRNPEVVSFSPSLFLSPKGDVNKAG